MMTVAGRLLRAALCTLTPLCLLADARAELVTGDIAFVGFNSDGQDDFAFVPLVDLAVGQEIHFNVNEWNGDDFISGFPLTWQATNGLSAGTVVVFSNTLVSSISVSHGIIPDEDQRLAISQEGDTILAYTGDPSEPDKFLAAISTNPDDYDDMSIGFDGTLNGTGLTVGTTALLLNPTGADIGGGVYTGPRSGALEISDYAPLIANINGNWMTDSNGESVLTNGQLDGTPFTTDQMGAVPEPPLALLLPMVLAVLLMIRRP